MTVFDFVFLGIVLASVLLGAWRGLVSEVIALCSWALAVFLAWRFAALIAPFVAPFVTTPALQWALAFVVIVVAVLLMLAVVRFLLRELLKAAGLGLTDRVAGALFGVVRAVLIALVLVGLCGLTSFPREAWWRGATFSAPLETVVIAVKPWLPKELAARIRYR
ncbi:CvpA family protein [Viridibacterium curvum]|uniref:CvpA family protein n=1 Tax=Viridibacterium curvum TaxID=1101404 RepID=A0ABP9QG54_9RHOO